MQRRGFRGGGLPPPGSLKRPEGLEPADTLCVLRPFHAARGGEASGVGPGTEMRQVARGSSRTRILVRRATPFAAVAAVFAVQALAQAEPVVAFPLYLSIVLLASLQPDRARSFAAAAVAAVAVALQPLAANRDASEVASSVLLAAVLLGVALAIGELTRHARAAASATERQLDELTASDRRLRAALESAEVGLGLSELDGKLIQVNERMAALLGRARDEVLGDRLVDLASPADPAGLAARPGVPPNGGATPMA